MRDSMLVLASLSCNQWPLLSAWFAELDTAHVKGGFFPHGYVPGAGYTSPRYTPDMVMRRAAMALEHERRCSKRPSRVAKVIRLNGGLSVLHNISQALRMDPPLVIHLVRDVRAVYASRKRLSGLARFGIPQASVKKRETEDRDESEVQLQAWARGICAATKRDALYGQRHMPAFYELVDYSTFIQRPQDVIEKLYSRHYRRPVPEQVYAFLRTHLPQQRNAGRRSNSSSTSVDDWQYRFSTVARDVERVNRQWENELLPWELAILDKHCRGPGDAASFMPSNSRMSSSH